MSKYAEILMGGSGGQGLIFISSFLAESAMADGLNVTQTQSYGIAQRGGYVSSEVIISSDEVLFQQVTSPDIVIALHDVVGARFDAYRVPVIYDSELIKNKSGDNWYGLPLSKLAQDIGAARAANLIAVGAALHFSPIVSLTAIAATAKSKFKADIAEMNIKAVRCGLEEAAKSFANRR